MTAAHETIWNIKEHLAAIVENDPSGIVATDEHGKIVVLNQAAKKIFSRNLSDIPEQHVQSLFSKGDYQRFLAKAFESEKTEEHIIAKNIELEMLGFDQIPAPANLSIVRLVDRAGCLMGFLFVIQDLKEVRMLQNKLIQGEKLKMLGQMAAGITHEINTPLGMIKGALAILKRELVGSNPKIEKNLSIINQATDRVSRFSQEFLNLAKPSQPNFCQMNIGDIVSKSVGMIKLKKQSKKYDIYLHKADDLPPVYGDQEKLLQVLLNLLDNAIDAISEDGHVSVQVEKASIQSSDILDSNARLRRKEDSQLVGYYACRRIDDDSIQKLPSFLSSGDEVLLIQIEDNGCGMSPELMKTIFDPFFTTKQAKGTGLGLSIVQSIIKRHFGAIGVHSQEGKGTRFTIKLPTFDKVIQYEREM